MKIKEILLVAFAFLIFPCIVKADSFAGMVSKGNKAFKEGDYGKALEYYHQAEVERPETPELLYNIGTALYGEKKYEEAVDKLRKSLATQDVANEAAGHYNLGNVYFRTGDYQKSIMSFQKSLELNPNDMDAKYNLELARKRLKEQMKPEKKDQQQQQQQQKDQNQQDQPGEPEQQKNQPEQKDQQKQEQQQQQQQKMNENEMTKEDAERILNAIKDDEKDLQKEQQRFKAVGDYQGNDW